MRRVVLSEGRESRRKPLAGLRSSLAPYKASSGDKQALATPEIEALFLESLLVRKEGLGFRARNPSNATGGMGSLAHAAKT